MRQGITEGRRTVSRYTFVLIAAGLLINILGVRLAHALELPIFLDSIGTVLAAALGGCLPGIIVGFASNAINSISDPITLYYGIISILIAVASAFAGRRRAFAHIRGALLVALLLAFIGGGLGSVCTWLLYGWDFGAGISAPFALQLFQGGELSRFAAQLVADLGIDLADKLLSVAAVSLLLALLPDGLLSRFYNGGLYLSTSTDADIRPDAARLAPKHSLRNRVVLMIVVTALIIGSLGTAISYALYNGSREEHYAELCKSAVELMADEVDPDALEGYLATCEEDDAYRETEARLKEIRESLDGIEYMYVYKLMEDGCHVVFDVDTPELAGEPLGALVAYDDTFAPYLPKLLSGQEIPPVISNDSYGWLLTVYKPIHNSQGRCVAYVAADANMSDVVTDCSVFIIRMVSLLFGAAVVIVMIVIWIAEREMVAPINAMAAATDSFEYDSASGRSDVVARLKALDINTGDEIERLYHTLERSMTDVSQYIGIIDALQQNTIMGFAALVESRDKCTGEHIKHTAAFVRVIANELLREGKYPGVLTEDAVSRYVRSAPLHDVGKVVVSDAILNKPGKLTPEEFELIKQHTVAGGDVLNEVLRGIEDPSYLMDARDMATCHHERWDGKGYPNGTAGEDIPLSARIMAVADVFDALISRRSYKEPMTAQDALATILAESGTHFDPAVVEAFAAAFDEVCENTK